LKIETKEATVISNVPVTKKRAMSIDASGMAHIMGLLTNLYNDRELAVIREYYTNGLDAHTAAGITKAVKITLPTWDKPNYVVQDFGIGMTEDDILNVYSQYGASTGRDSNDIVGGFGLGSKSAFTIANQFTVVSTKDGIRTTALFSKTANGVYDAQIVNSLRTTESNGTLVSIPINTHISTFNNKAYKFFAFSKPGTVLVDGSEPHYALHDAQCLENPNNPDMEIFLKPKQDGESYVIMGSVPYVLSNSEIQLSLSRLNVTASAGFVRMPKYFPVPIGSVDLSPNREGLQMTDKTNDLIDSYMSFIVNDLQEIAKKEIDEVKTLEEFYEAHSRWNNIISVPKKYKGEAVPNEIKLDKLIRIIVKTNWGNASHTETDWLNVKVLSPRIVVTGYSSENYKKVNGYLTPYMTAKDIDRATFIITDSKDILTDKWVQMSEHFTFVSGDDIIAIGREQRKKERQEASKLNGTAKKSKIKYPVLFVEESEVRWVDHDEIDQSTPYLHAADMMGSMSDTIKSVYKAFQYDIPVSDTTSKYFELVTDATEIILLGNTRTTSALQQRVKETRPLINEIKEAVSKLDTIITDDLVRYHAVNQSTWKRFLVSSGINDMIDDVKDPAIIEIINPTAKTLEDYERFETVTGAFECFRFPGMGGIKSIDITKDKTVEKLDAKYPLVSALNAWSLKRNGVKHVVKYLNMVHEDSKLPIGA
jgi:DNA topoisomerase VI subunit B